jgi:HAD superfamily hydrolase (TIGR01549 family)
MKILAWIFDLGNTLMAIPDEFDEENLLTKILGYTDTEQVRSIVYRLCDKFQGQSIEDFLQRFDQSVNPTINTSLSIKIREAWMESVQHAQLKPGAWEILDDLRDKKMKIVLISNTPPTSHYILDFLKLRERFDIIIFSCDVGYLKPDPRIFKIALDKLGVPPQNTIVVGDKIRTDILGGAILGMKSILVEVRSRSIVENGQNYVDAIIPRLVDLRKTKLYEEMNK